MLCTQGPNQAEAGTEEEHHGRGDAEDGGECEGDQHAQCCGELRKDNAMHRGAAANQGLFCSCLEKEEQDYKSKSNYNLLIKIMENDAEAGM